MEQLLQVGVCLLYTSRESGGNCRTGSGDRRKIRDTVSEICADLSDGKSVIPEAFLNTNNKVIGKRAGN